MRTLILILLIIPIFSFGKSDSINCYIEIQDIYDLDYNKSTVKVDFFIVLEFTNYDSLGFSILNGIIMDRELQHLDDEEKFYCERIHAELRINFDFDRFPLDKQFIELQIEPNSYFENQVFFSRPEQNIFVGETHLNGWYTQDVIFKSIKKTYRINEKIDTKYYSYQIATYIIPLYRKNSLLYFVKSFFPSILSILIIYIGFLFPLNYIEPKLNLSVGSLFVMISNLIVTQQLLPDISAITLLEKLNFVSLIIISLTILYFVLTFRYRESFTGITWRRTNLLFIVSSLILISILTVTILI